MLIVGFEVSTIVITAVAVVNNPHSSVAVKTTVPDPVLPQSFESVAGE